MNRDLKSEHRKSIERNIHLRKLLSGEKIGPLTGIPTKDKPWLLEYREEDLANFPLIEKSVFRYLYDSNVDHLDDVVIEFANIQITNSQLIEGIIDTASALKKIGVEEGDFVSICLPNTPESACFLYACSILGAVADFIDPLATEEGLENYLNISNPKYLVTMDCVLDKFKNLIDKKGIKKVISTSPIESIINMDSEAIMNAEIAFREKEKDFIGKTDAEVMTYKKFIDDAKGAFTLEEMEVEYKPLRPVSIVHSGGTTGVPKGVKMSNDNLNSFAAHIMMSNLGYKRGNKLLSLMPEFVGYGLSLGLHVARVAGMRTVMIAEYIPEKIAELIIAHKPNVITASPAHFELFSRSPLINETVDLSNLESFIVGGSAIHPKVEQMGNDKLLKCGSKHMVRKGYGFTENNCAVTMCIKNEVNVVGGCGVPLPFTDITIYDSENKKDLGYNQIGEVCVTGPDLMMEYHNNPFENESALQLHDDGRVWFHSGDLGSIDDEGKFKCTGRIKDLIILYNGQKVYPTDVENILSHHPDVKSIAIVGMQDPEHLNGEIPVAFVVLKDGVDEKEALFSLDCFASEFVISYSVPQSYHSVHSLPMTKTGKVDKKLLKLALKNEIETKCKIYSHRPKENL